MKELTLEQINNVAGGLPSGVVNGYSITGVLGTAARIGSRINAVGRAFS